MQSMTDKAKWGSRSGVATRALEAHFKTSRFAIHGWVKQYIPDEYRPLSPTLKNGSYFPHRAVVALLLAVAVRACGFGPDATKSVVRAHVPRLLKCGDPLCLVLCDDGCGEVVPERIARGSMATIIERWRPRGTLRIIDLDALVKAADEIMADHARDVVLDHDAPADEPEHEVEPVSGARFLCNGMVNPRAARDFQTAAATATAS